MITKYKHKFSKSNQICIDHTKKGSRYNINKSNQSICEITAKLKAFNKHSKSILMLYLFNKAFNKYHIIRLAHVGEEIGLFWDTPNKGESRAFSACMIPV